MITRRAGCDDDGRALDTTPGVHSPKTEPAEQFGLGSAAQIMVMYSEGCKFSARRRRSGSSASAGLARSRPECRSPDENAEIGQASAWSIAERSSRAPITVREEREVEDHGAGALGRGEAAHLDGRAGRCQGRRRSRRSHPVHGSRWQSWHRPPRIAASAIRITPRKPIPTALQR